MLLERARLSRERELSQSNFFSERDAFCSKAWYGTNHWLLHGRFLLLVAQTSPRYYYSFVWGKPQVSLFAGWPEVLCPVQRIGTGS